MFILHLVCTSVNLQQPNASIKKKLTKTLVIYDFNFMLLHITYNSSLTGSSNALSQITIPIDKWTGISKTSQSRLDRLLTASETAT